jgi:excisionase family DNA binding protein
MADDIDLAALVKATKLAQWLDLHVGTVQRWIHQGRLIAVKIGRHWYVAKADALALCQRSQPRQRPEKARAKVPKTSAWAKAVLARHGLVQD